MRKKLKAGQSLPDAWGKKGKGESLKDDRNEENGNLDYFIRILIPDQKKV